MGAAFLGMLPHALERAAAFPVLGTVLAGMILFFLLEKVVLWRHCHDGQCDIHGTAGPLILMGDALHNFVDGVVIAAAFLTAVPLGIATALAVVAHEIPQEVGDFVILLDGGYSRTLALALNTLSALAVLPGAFLGYLALESIQNVVPYILALSAASFLYIAAADLIPTLHRRMGFSAGVVQLLLIFAGIGTVLFLQPHS